MLSTFPLRNSRYILGGYIKENCSVYHLCWSKLSPGRVPSVRRSPSLGLTPVTSSGNHGLCKLAPLRVLTDCLVAGGSISAPLDSVPPRECQERVCPVDSCHVIERLPQVFLPLAFTTQHIRPWSVCEEPWILLESWLICCTFQAQILRVTI